MNAAYGEFFNNFRESKMDRKRSWDIYPKKKSERQCKSQSEIHATQRPVLRPNINN